MLGDCVHFLQITVKYKDKAQFHGDCVWLDLYQLTDVFTLE